MALEIVVNIPSKTLIIEGKPMKLEESLTDASTKDSTPEEPVLTLEYRGDFPEDDSPAQTEADKIEETYGVSLYKKTLVSPNMTPDAHYLTFCGGINARVQR